MSNISYRMFLKDGTEVGRASVPGYIPWGYKISFFILNHNYVTVEPVNSNTEGEPDYTSLPIKEARALFERGYFAAQLCRFDGNMCRTAEFVGMHTSALYRKMRGLGMINRRARLQDSHHQSEADGSLSPKRRSLSCGESPSPLMCGS